MKLICGMHRSGTSLIAGLAHHIGADLGDEKTFYPADKWNPGGYFEQREVQAVNMHLVNGPFLGRASYLKLPSDRTIARRGRRLASEIQVLSERYRGRVVKENRFCLTLGAWKNWGGVPDRLLMVFRDPHAVARSLRRRNWVPSRLAMRLWMTHHLRLMHHAEGIPVSMLWYDELVSGERSAARPHRRLARFLDVDTESVARTAKSAIRPPVKRKSTPLPADVARLYNKLQEMNADLP